MTMCNRARLCWCVLLAISLSGCTSAAQRQADGATEQQQFPTPHTAEEARECGWDRTAHAWIDTNADGRLDAGEPPLQGVEISAYFFGSSKPEQPFPPTDPHGYTHLLEMLWGCPDWQIEVKATLPRGYRLTTKQPILSAYPDGEDEQPFLFGFVQDK